MPVVPDCIEELVQPSWQIADCLARNVRIAGFLTGFHIWGFCSRPPLALAGRRLRMRDCSHMVPNVKSGGFINRRSAPKVRVSPEGRGPGAAAIGGVAPAPPIPAAAVGAAAAYFSSSQFCDEHRKSSLAKGIEVRLLCHARRVLKALAHRLAADHRGVARRTSTPSRSAAVSEACSATMGSGEMPGCCRCLSLRISSLP